MLIYYDIQYKKEQDMQLANEEAQELLNFQVLLLMNLLYTAIEEILHVLSSLLSIFPDNREISFS